MAKRRPSGNSMVRKRENGRWEGRIVLHQSIECYQDVELTEDSRMTLGEWLDRWLEQITSVLQSSTPEHYRSDMEHHVKLYLG